MVRMEDGGGREGLEGAVDEVGKRDGGRGVPAGGRGEVEAVALRLEVERLEDVGDLLRAAAELDEEVAGVVVVVEERLVEVLRQHGQEGRDGAAARRLPEPALREPRVQQQQAAAVVLQQVRREAGREHARELGGGGGVRLQVAVVRGEQVVQQLEVLPLEQAQLPQRHGPGVGRSGQHEEVLGRGGELPYKWFFMFFSSGSTICTICTI